MLAALLYALAVHVKIYPVTYAPALYLFLESDQGNLSQKSSKDFVVQRTWSDAVTNFLWSLRPTWNRVKFAVVAGIALALLTVACYAR